MLVAALLGTLPGGGAVAADTSRQRVDALQGDRATTIVVPAGARGTVRIPVTVDRSTIDARGTTNDRSVEIAARRGDGIVEVLDAYPSRPQGLMRCQAGRETYYRVLDTARRRQLFARLVDSCLVEDVAANDPLITRSADGAEVTLHGLYASVTLRIGPGGVVTVMP